jgi:hypothetical protein
MTLWRMRNSFFHPESRTRANRVPVEGWLEAVLDV